MKLKALIEELQKHSEDMEVVIGNFYQFENEIEVTKINSLVNELGDGVKVYYNEDTDDYWAFSYKKEEVLLLW